MALKHVHCKTGGDYRLLEMDDGSFYRLSEFTRRNILGRQRDAIQHALPRPDLVDTQGPGYVEIPEGTQTISRISVMGELSFTVWADGQPSFVLNAEEVRAAFED